MSTSIIEREIFNTQYILDLDVYLNLSSIKCIVTINEHLLGFYGLYSIPKYITVILHRMYATHFQNQSN